MKKKGLIISTIVMVVVLIASLTTATYAWFSASSSTKVDELSLTIDANSAVAIGAHVSSGNTLDDYMYNTVTLGHGAANAATANDPTYSSGETGLGTKLGFSTVTSLNLSTGVNSATAVSERTGSGTELDPYVEGSVTGPATTSDHFEARNKVYKAAASAASDANIDDTTILYANANEDYIVLKMGAQAAQTGIKGIYATVTVTTTGSATTLKMAAALHFYIRVANRFTAETAASYNTEHSLTGDAAKVAGDLTGTYKFVEFDLFGDEHSGASKAQLGESGHTTGATGVVLSHSGSGKAAQGVATFSFLIAGVDDYTAAATLANDGSYITPFEIYAYVWGPDSDCVSTATGCGVKINIEFFGVSTANSGLTMLALSNEAELA